jgi:hypothetical protein
MRHDRGAESLELEQDIQLERMEWNFERAGWIALAFLLIAGLSGAFGNGYLAGHCVATADGRGTVHYDRIARHGAPTPVTFELAAASPGDTSAILSLDTSWLDGLDVQRVLPEPEETRTSASRVEYRFRRAAPGAPLRVVFSTQPVALGSRRGSAITPFGAMEIRQFVMP